MKAEKGNPESQLCVSSQTVQKAQLMWGPLINQLMIHSYCGIRLKLWGILSDTLTFVRREGTFI